MAAVTEAGTAVYVIDVATGRQLQRLDAHAVVRSAEFGPGNRTLIAGCADRKHPGRIWNVGNWSQVQDAPQDGMPPKKGGDGTAEWRQIYLSADGRSLLALRDDGKLSVCDPQTGQALRRLAEGDGTPYVTGAISTDGALALGITADDTLRLWDARSGLPLRILEIPPKLKKSGLRAAISPDGKRIVAGDKSGVLHAWDVATGRHLYASAGQGSIINQVTFADAAGRVVLTAHSNARINVWEAETGRPLRSITVTDTAIVADIDCIPARGLVAAGLRHGRIYFLDFELLSRWRDQRPRAEQAARTLRDTPDDPQALLTMGRWYALHGLLDMAGGLMIRACERGAEVSPLELGRIFWQTDQFDAAAAEFRRAIELAKDDGERGYLRACLAAVSQKSKAPATQETE
jgi:WD40 repeat protein